VDAARPPIPRPEHIRLEKIHKDGMSQATIRVGSIGITRNNPDYVAVVLLNYILGGSGFGSRLMRRLREQGGLTYGVHSNFQPRRDPGYFFVECQTNVLTMNEALAAIFDEIRRLRREGVTEEELDWAVRYFSGSLPLSLQTNDQLATRVLEQEFYSLEEEFWLKDIDRMLRTRREEVNEAAHQYLSPESFAVVCLADFGAADLRMPEPA
jgi:zinc protease